MDEVLIRMTAGQHFPELLEGPVCRWMACDVDMQDRSTTVFYGQKHIKEPETRRYDGEEIASYSYLRVIPDKGEPTLLWIRTSPWSILAQILLDRARRDGYAQLQLQFIGDPLLSPSRVLRCDLSDQLPKVLRQFWPTCRLGLPAPEESKTLTVPADESGRLNYDKRVAPVEEPAQDCE